MLILGPIGIVAPWVLWGLAVVPLLWIVLRAVPPAPVRRQFAALALLLGLQDGPSTRARTPWWLLVLRALAVALIIVAFAGPVWRPSSSSPAPARDVPLLIALDASWAQAPDWSLHVQRARQELTGLDRPAAVVLLTAPPAALTFQTAEDLLPALAAADPHPWEPQAGTWAEAQVGAFDTLWLSDGLARADRDRVLQALQARGQVRVVQPPRPLAALRTVQVVEGGLTVQGQRLPQGAASLLVQAIGPDPAGMVRVLGQGALDFEVGATEAQATLDLPLELRNRVQRVVLGAGGHAGTVHLAADSLQRRKVGLVPDRGGRERLSLLDPLHYVRAALDGLAVVVEGDLATLQSAGVDVIILVDQQPGADAAALRAWVEAGGGLIRFAGPLLAREAAQDPLLPVGLRAGGRTLGGAMSWSTPKQIAPFDPSSLFAGLAVPEDVEVTSQVLAQPSADLAQYVLASLQDGTPLVTRKPLGEGAVTLFHVTANAQWSNLPLSGLFAQMLTRLVQSSAAASAPGGELQGDWRLEQALDAFGQLASADPAPPLDALRLVGPVSSEVPPGIYAGAGGRRAVNALDGRDALAAATWPASVPVEGALTPPPRPLVGALLAVAAGLLCLDVLASLAVTGRLLVLAAFILVAPHAPRAQEDFSRATEATRGVALAHVITGDSKTDELARAGLEGLRAVLTRRTTVRPEGVFAVDIETDELAFYPLLYWPVTANEILPSAQAIARLTAYLHGGGVILFDLRDGNLAGLGGDTPEAARLRAIAGPLDLPTLEPMPKDHVLTRSFYLLEGAPGRYTGALWTETLAPGGADTGLPFRASNDGVSPVVIGGNDWAGAWAVDEAGYPLLPVGRGTSGERQRELAYRFGINLMMYALTGNYKSDQVHVPALLDRLGEGK